jgi:hypothetical protein
MPYHYTKPPIIPLATPVPLHTACRSTEHSMEAACQWAARVPAVPSMTQHDAARGTAQQLQAQHVSNSMSAVCQWAARVPAAHSTAQNSRYVTSQLRRAVWVQLRITRDEQEDMSANRPT